MPAQEFDAGTVHVQVVPTLQGWVDSVQKQLRKELRDKGFGQGIPVSVDPKINDRALQREMNRIAKAHKGELVLTPKLDEAGLKKEAERAAGHFADTFTRQMQSTLRNLPDFDLNADLSDVQRALAVIRAEVEEISDIKFDADFDEEDVLARVRALAKEAKELDGQAIDIRTRTDASKTARELDELARKMYATSTAAQRDIAAIRAQIDSIQARRVNLEISTEEARDQLARLKAQLDALERDTASVTVHAEVADAMLAMATVDAELTRLDGAEATVDVKADDHGSFHPLNTRMERLIWASVAASGAIGGLGAAFVVFAAAAIGAGAAIAATAVGITDIAKAMKAQTAASEQAGQTAAQEAAQRLVATNQVLSAQESLANAHRAVGEAARRSSDTVRQAVANQARAERDLADAQADALRAQQALTGARLEAQRALEDLNARVVDDALAQRQAVLDLADAQDALNTVMADPAATDRQRQAAQLAFDQAKQHLTEVGVAYQRSQADADAANKAGVDGAKQVVDAQQSIVDANTRVQDAQAASAEAARKTTEARLEGAEAVADAQRQAIAAQRSLADAQARATVQAQQQGTAQAKLADAWAKLTPASQDLIGYLRIQSGEWLALHQASQAFAPGALAGLKTLQPHFAQLNTNVATVSGSMGDFFGVIATGLVDAEPFFTTIAESTRTILPRFGESINRAGTAVGGLVTAMIPLAPSFAAVADSASDLLVSWTPFLASASGPLLGGMHQLLDSLKVLGPVLDAIAAPLADLTNAIVGGLSQGLQNLVDGGLKEFLNAAVDLVQAVSPLIATAGTLAGTLGRALVPILHDLTLVLTPLVSAIDGLAKVLDLLPTPIMAVITAMGLFRLAAGPLAKLGSAMSTAFIGVGIGASNAVTALGGSKQTVDKFAVGFGKVEGVLSKVGKALPFVGLGLVALGAVFDLNRESAAEHAKAIDEGARALIRGGEAAKKVADQQSFLGTILKDGGSAMREMQNRAADLTRELGPVGTAQEELAQATQDYNTALANNGPTAKATADAHDVLITKVGALKRAQDSSAESTKTATERLREQQDAQLASASAATAFQRAGLDVQRAALRIDQVKAQNIKNDKAATAAAKAHADAVKEFGKKSPQATDALAALTDAQATALQNTDNLTSAELDLKDAQIRVVGAAGAAAAAQAEANGQHEHAKEVAQAQAGAVRDLIKVYGTDLPPAVLAVLDNLGAVNAQMLGIKTKVDETGKLLLVFPGTDGGPEVSIVVKDNLDEEARRISKFGTAFDTLMKDFWSAGAEASGLDIPMPKGKSTPKTMYGWEFARGGRVGGTGSGDTVPIMATPGEYVFSRPAVANLGGPSTVDALHRSAVHGYARGGLVRPLGFAAGGTVPTVTPTVVAGGSDSSGDGGANLADIAALTALFTDMTAAAQPATSAITDNMIPALNTLSDRSAATATSLTQDWQAITASVAQAVALITGTYLAALRAGLATVDAAVANTARGFAAQWQAAARATADPVRWMLTYPYNALINAWNVIDTSFAVGKHLAPIPVTFAAGGSVEGGRAGQDSVPALLTPGEFVAPVPMVEQIGMANLEAARRAVLGGGSVEGIVPGYEAGGAVTKGLTYAQANAGKPYIWGGVGPAGFDCSGWISAIANVTLGQPPNRRRFTTADFATDRGAGGFVPGQGSTFVIGVSGSHMAGTLAGVNLESTTKNGFSGTRVGGDAASPLDAQFTKGTFFLPQLGGTFIPTPSGSAFTLAGLLDSTFADTHAAVAALAGQFGANTMAAGASAEMLAMLSAITGWASTNLGGPTVAGTGPAWDQIHLVAGQHGWGDGPQWDALKTLIGRESGGNPNAQNPTSTAYGIGQLLDGTWAGTGIAKTDNPALQTEAMLRYISGRYRDPASAWSFWQGHHWYDDGGVLPPGISLAYNGTGRGEAVLTPRQLASVGASGQGGGQFTGELYLDGGQFLGLVRGEIASTNEATARSISRRTRM